MLAARLGATPPYGVTVSCLPAHRRLPRALAGLLALGLVAGCTGGGAAQRQADSGDAAARAFLAAWQDGEDKQAALRTDRPAAARAGLSALRDGLRLGSVRLTPGQFSPGTDSAPPRLAYRVALHLASLGDWSYDSALTLVRTTATASAAQRPGPAGGWVVHWAPSVLHPQLTGTTRLERVRRLPARAPVLDRRGAALMRERPVVDIGIEPRALRNPGRVYAALADTLDIDPESLRRRVDLAPPAQLVSVITLRQPDYAAVADRLRGLDGLRFAGRTLSLAATATFGRALLGRVGPATAETLRHAGPMASPVDAVGDSGLQYAFQRQLAGSPGGAVRLVGRDGGVQATLHRFAARPGRPLRTTLDAHLQRAAERALATRHEPTALVAVQPSTGEILAVADGPAGAAYDRARLGHYPPGSTFKVVTAAALLADGLRPGTAVPCSGTVSAGGRRFENYDGLGALGPIPFRRAFAESCNTAFVAASRRLDDAALTEQAKAFGVGAGWRLPVESYAGSVPPAASVVEQAADAIGQGRVSVSPLGMALVAATARAGVFRPPTLLAGQHPPAGAPFDPVAARDLRAMMRETVTAGTAEVLDLPGVPVAAKTGTAEYGTTSPPRTHAWIIGYRGDLAFAVLVEGGSAGGAVAGPVARRFLQAAG